MTELKLEISPGMREYPELVQMMNENDGLGLMPPQAALAAATRSPRPDDWMEAVALLCFRHENTIHMQLASEPFPNEFPPEDVLNLADVLQDAIHEFSNDHPDLEYPISAEEEVRLLRSRAGAKTHDVTRENMESIIQAAREAGSPLGFTRQIVMEICEEDPRVARNLMQDSQLEWQKCVTEEQAEAVLKFAREQGLDVYAALALDRAMGHHLTRRPERRRTDQQHNVRDAMERASEEAMMDWYVTQRALTAL